MSSSPVVPVSETGPMVASGAAAAADQENVPIDLEEQEQEEQPEADGADLFQRKKRKKKSAVWKEFEEIKMENGERKAQCIHCKEFLSIQTTGSTTHLARHLKDSCTQRKLKLKNQSKLNFQHVASKVEAPLLFSGKYDHAKQREATAHWILMHEKAFNVVEEDGYNFMMQVNQPEFSKIPRSQARTDCITVYAAEKKKLKTHLKNVSKVSLTTDIWTSTSQKMSYICLTGHFVDADWSLQKRVLSFVEIPPPHTGIEVAEALSRCIKDWEIESKILSLSVDNASYNDVAVRILRDTFLKARNLPLEGKLFHVRCCAHILNLIVQDGLKSIKDVIFNVRETVKFINYPSRLKRFAEIVKQMQLPVRKLVLDCPTRWNSTYDMLVVALKFKDALPVYAQVEPLYNNCPSVEEWKMVEHVIKILVVFSETTNMISGSEYPTCNKYLAVVARVKEKLDQRQHDETHFVWKMVKDMKEKFDKYWKDCNLLMCIAAVLDPRCKMLMINYVFGTLCSEEEAESQISKVQKALLQLFNEYKDMKEMSSHHGRGSNGTLPSSSNDLVQTSSNVITGWSRYDQYVRAAQTVQPAKSELEI